MLGVDARGQQSIWLLNMFNLSHIAGSSSLSHLLRAPLNVAVSNTTCL